MAANLQSRGFGSFGKRFINQIWSATSKTPSQLLPSSSSPTSAVIRRGAHYSVYDKNIDDQLRPSIVPDDVIQPLSENYWGPNPQTGVFGPPASEKNGGGPTVGDHGGLNYPHCNGVGSTESVLELKAWFRPLEDVEKPQQN